MAKQKTRAELEAEIAVLTKDCSDQMERIERLLSVDQKQRQDLTDVLMQVRRYEPRDIVGYPAESQRTTQPACMSWAQIFAAIGRLQAPQEQLVERIEAAHGLAREAVEMVEKFAEDNRRTK